MISIERPELALIIAGLMILGFLCSMYIVDQAIQKYIEPFESD